LNGGRWGGTRMISDIDGDFVVVAEDDDDFRGGDVGSPSAAGSTAVASLGRPVV